MANPQRGELKARIDGRDYTLCLTLGALAELEQALAKGDLVSLVERFSSGRFSALEIARLLGSGLRGGGHAISDEDVLAMKMDGGITAFAGLARDLLNVTFAERGGEHVEQGGALPPKP